MVKGKLRRLFSNAEVERAYADCEQSISHTAAALTRMGRGTVSRQLVSYWIRHLNLKTKNGKTYVGTTVLDRNIRSEMELRVPTREDYEAAAPAINPATNEMVLVIPDLHAPYQHQDALEFLKAVKDRYSPTRVVNLGDEVDNHALSFHDSDPNLDSAGVELNKARVFIKDLAEIFPVMDVMHSNHGSLVYRRAFKSGIPVEYIKSYRDILFPDGGGDGWGWHESLKIELPDGSDVLFAHHLPGDPVMQGARNRCSTVFGHLHAKYDITYSASEESLWFAMRAGCLIDKDSMAFAYGKMFTEKPIVGCAVIDDSIPRLVPMLLDKGGRWVGKLGS